MSKERLEEIRESVKHDLVHNDGMMISVNLRQMEWLIEQAERVQELESESYNAHLERLLGRRERQNKRYREALEKISGPIYKVTYADMFAVKRIARQALESDYDE